MGEGQSRVGKGRPRVGEDGSCVGECRSCAGEAGHMWVRGPRVGEGATCG